MRLLYFAWVRERVGVGEEEVAPPSSVTTVAELVAWLAAASERHAAAFAEPARLRAAVDQAFVPLDASIAGAREVAIFPPVTGG
ncbi:MULTISPECIES: molybdopterin converting factor subunit 1 [unclassified Sphingomonas]|uniref:molybdopterin converting factor subunit 1 n=1 Tax=unclassified Sphingomonas TaxID=196159 RepID=UPI00161D0331|nr:MULTISPECIES: molybdopterin converting factor subunit 1 [unclassified Sphingomonas]MBB3346317.1 molybdopterin synthase sulfur carrier subunit [Sphingomonas sp. BK069]MBB3473372.1 molybdopterin synthase sulfur carrier subunit [Sphingomonas sp. BK345]